MILPDNGKVVIIDDQIDDVINLISGLSSEKIPFVYYKDVAGDDLPEKPLTNVRLIFLDLLLIDDSIPPIKKVVSSIITRLKRILSPDNGPYILIYWSTQKKKYSKALEKELNKKSLRRYKPFEILSLTKPSTIAQVKEELAKRFEKFKSLKAFFLFESLTNKAAGDVVNHFAELFVNDNSWDKNLKDVLYKTGEARVGQSTYKALNDSDKVKNSLLTISSVIQENIDSGINKTNFDMMNFEPLVKYDTTEDAKAKFNSKLHLGGSQRSNIKSGTIYFVQKKMISDEIFNKIKDPSKDTSKIKPKLFFIDLTSVCDYAQDKNYVRGVYGILLNSDEMKLMLSSKSRPAYFKLSPMFNIHGKIQFLVLDFRFAESVMSSAFFKRKWKPALKIGSELFTEFQAEFGKHINRPGFTSLY